MNIKKEILEKELIGAFKTAKEDFSDKKIILRLVLQLIKQQQFDASFFLENKEGFINYCCRNMDIDIALMNFNNLIEVYNLIDLLEKNCIDYNYNNFFNDNTIVDKFFTEEQLDDLMQYLMKAKDIQAYNYFIDCCLSFVRDRRNSPLNNTNFLYFIDNCFIKYFPYFFCLSILEAKSKLTKEENIIEEVINRCRFFDIDRIDEVLKFIAKYFPEMKETKETIISTIRNFFYTSDFFHAENSHRRHPYLRDERVESHQYVTKLIKQNILDCKKSFHRIINMNLSLNKEMKNYFFYWIKENIIYEEDSNSFVNELVKWSTTKIDVDNFYYYCGQDMDTEEKEQAILQMINKDVSLERLAQIIMPVSKYNLYATPTLRIDISPLPPKILKIVLQQIKEEINMDIYDYKSLIQNIDVYNSRTMYEHHNHLLEYVLITNFQTNLVNNCSECMPHLFSCTIHLLVSALKEQDLPKIIQFLNDNFYQHIKYFYGESYCIDYYFLMKKYPKLTSIKTKKQALSHLVGSNYYIYPFLSENDKQILKEFATKPAIPKWLDI